MSSKNQTDAEASDTASTSDPSPWKWYKRRSDNKKVEARLVEGKHLVEVRESKSEDYWCPDCKSMLSKGNSKDFPHVFLPPSVFHERHRPLSDD